MLDAVIASDFHLGSSNCQAKVICGFLERILDQEILTSRLILNGDIFDSLDFNRLDKHHWKVLSTIRKLSDKIDVSWLLGNHDGPASVVSHLLGVHVYNDYVFKSGDKKILVLHGHIFDDFITRFPIATAMADYVYKFLQWVDKTHYFAKMAKHGSKTFLRCAEQVKNRAIKYADKKLCSAVICGHTHMADFPISGSSAIDYYNTGCFTELPCGYAEVQEGKILIRFLNR